MNAPTMRRHAYASLALSVLLLTACKEEEPPPAPLRPVLTMTVVPKTMDVFGPFASVVEARYQTQLGFQLSGRMVARDVYVGDVVRKGQRLAALDPTVTQFALNRAQADVADAKAQLLNAQGIEQRQRLLAAGGNAPQAALDNAVAGLATAKARLDQTNAALHVAEDQMGYTELHANFDGVITAWNAEVGQYVTNGQAVVTVARPEMREAVVDIADDLMIAVHTGMVFQVRSLVAPNSTATAVVREIGPLADAATRSHRVRLTLKDTGLAFRIGTTILVAVERPTPPRIYVPATAVVETSGPPFVWIFSPENRTVTQRQVRIAGRDGDRVLVADGLKEGDRIVTVGVHSLRDGQAVAGDASAASALTKAKSTRL